MRISKPFNPEKELKRIKREYRKKHLILSLIVLVVMVSIGTSYAIFSIDPQTHLLIKSKVGKFSLGDIKLSVFVDGVKQDKFPSKDSGYLYEKIECEKGSIGDWDLDSWQLILSANGPDKCSINFVKGVLFTDYLVNLFEDVNEGQNGMYIHDGKGTYTNSNQEAGDNSYRYSGSNPNNYVCFGTDISPCPLDNLYRIIGIFDGYVKLIKYDYANKDELLTDGAYFGSDGTPKDSYKGTLDKIPWYKWSNSNNSWEESELNLINLNKNFLTELGNWGNFIEYSDWNIGGAFSNNIRKTNAKTAFDYEVGSKRIEKKYQAKIGLMYVSDYYFAALPEHWLKLGAGTTDNDYRTATSDNWMYMGGLDWTITKGSDGTSSSYNVSWLGYVNITRVTSDNGIRPTFYLKKYMKYFSGDGSYGNPYIIY